MAPPTCCPEAGGVELRPPRAIPPPLNIGFNAADRGTPAAASWREGRFANWTVKLGERQLRLHKFILARSSTFFEAAMSEIYESSRTDLTGMLPRKCWPLLDDILDAMYSEGKETVQARLRQWRESAGSVQQEDGILNEQNVVVLLAAADMLGVQDLFDRAVVFFNAGRRMQASCLTFWQACFDFDSPLSPALEKVAATARAEALQGFERLLETEQQALLALPPEALLGLLRDDDLAVRSELRLALFLVEYGVQNLAGEHSSPCRGSEAQSWRQLCAALRWGELDCDLQSKDDRQALRRAKVQHACELEPGIYVVLPGVSALVVTAGVARHSEVVRRVGVGTQVRVLEVIHAPDQQLIRGRIEEPCGYISLRNTATGFTWVRPHSCDFRQAIFGNCPFLADHFPEEFLLVGTAQGRVRTFGRHLVGHIPHGITLQPRTPVRPAHAPQLLSNQAEQFFYFCPGNWRQKECIHSNPGSAGPLSFRLKVYPCGDEGVDVSDGEWVVSAFLEVLPCEHWPDNWEFRKVEYSITCVAWQDPGGQGELNIVQRDAFDFKADCRDRGWPIFLSSQHDGESLSHLLSPQGYLLIQAQVAITSVFDGPHYPGPMAGNQAESSG